MKLDIRLVSKESLDVKGNLSDPNIGSLLNGADSAQDLFDVDIAVGDASFSRFSHSLYSLTMDLMINQRLLSSRKKFGFFISDDPVFSISYDNHDVVYSYFDSKKRRVEFREKFHELDRVLSHHCCIALSILEKISPNHGRRIFSDVDQDLSSQNRIEFIDQ